MLALQFDRSVPPPKPELLLSIAIRAAGVEELVGRCPRRIKVGAQDHHWIPTGRRRRQPEFRKIVPARAVMSVAPVIEVIAPWPLVVSVTLPPLELRLPVPVKAMLLPLLVVS